MQNHSQIVAQVAVEAIVNVNGCGYELNTMHTVLMHARELGVSDLYTELLAELVNSAAIREEIAAAFGWDK